MNLTLITSGAGRDLSSVDVYDLADELYEAPRPCNGGGEDPDAWFPVVADCRAIRVEHSRAIALCRRCPVRAVCLEFALRSEHGEFGIWAGTTPCERAALLDARDGGAGTVRHVTGCPVRRSDRVPVEHEGRAA